MAGRWFLRNQGNKMRLTTSPKCFRSLLASLFLGAILILPAVALAQDTPPPQAESSGEGTLSGQPQPVYPNGPPYSTPSGTFNATSMNKMWYSRQWDNAPMPHAIFFTKKGHAIHGTHETKKLGTPASKGCVRLSPKHAEKLFALVKEKGMENTEIVLAGLTPGGEAKIAAPSQRAYPPGNYAPWFERPYGYDRPRRRGLFGNRRWRDNAQGYNGRRYNQPRGVAPWGY
jgi:hypothetical protein